MDKLGKSSRSLRIMTWLFIIIGIIEISFLVSMTFILTGIIVGLTTIIPAIISFKEKNTGWKYTVGIIAIIKYNPFFGIAQLAYIISDFSKVLGNQPGKMVFAVVVMILSVILGVLIIVKTVMHRKLLKSR